VDVTAVSAKHWFGQAICRPKLGSAKTFCSVEQFVCLNRLSVRWFSTKLAEKCNPKYFFYSGPTFASALFTIGGFSFPFLVIGTITLLTALMLWWQILEIFVFCAKDVLEKSKQMWRLKFMKRLRQTL
jgi:hypothetical protein